MFLKSDRSLNYKSYIIMICYLINFNLQFIFVIIMLALHLQCLTKKWAWDIISQVDMKKRQK